MAGGTVFRSPNEMFAEATKQMLGGRAPETKNDWNLVVAFWAANVHRGVAHEAIRVLCMVYDVPLSPEIIFMIVAGQLACRGLETD